MESEDKAMIAEASERINSRTITLETPIKRGETSISSVTVRRPFGPALRGLSLAKLINQADYDSYEALIPRVTEPVITKLDIQSGGLDPVDLVRLTEEIGYFFLPKLMRQEIDYYRTQ